jgi:CubicO group peptidase (beta-lactamase class C family)
MPGTADARHAAMRTSASSVGVKIATLASKLASLIFLFSIAGLGVAGCGAPENEAPDEPVATESSSLVTSGPGCADGSVEQTYKGGMVGCSGTVTWDKRRNLCGGGYRAATANEWLANWGGTVPEHNYWTNEDLQWSGSGPSACSAVHSGGNPCGSNSPMRVCTTSGNDAEGNFCNWTICGLDSGPANYFGGCVNNPTAGTLCIPTACSDGTVEETFANGMVGCAGAVTWDNRRALCSDRYRPATAKEWATLGGVAPQHNYWTDDPLKVSGSGPSACAVSLTTGSDCWPQADAPMLVCTMSGTDPEGNACDWTNCGLDGNTPNKFFGGCPSNKKAGTLCVPEGCADATTEQTFPNGMVGCAGNASSAAAAAPLCAPGYRLASAAEFNQLSHEEIRNGSIIGLTHNFWTQTNRLCRWWGCGTNPTGGALCVPQRGCADGTAEQVMPEGFVGCAGTVTWDNRNSLCARGYRTATSKEWKTLNSFAVQIVPTHNYWTADPLGVGGNINSCFASMSGSSCWAGRPMRICKPSATDPVGNGCGWTNCGLDTVSPNLYFGGCSYPNAGALCVPDISPDNILDQSEDQRLLNIIQTARSTFPETPAIAAAVIVDDKIYLAAVGKRKWTDTSNTLLVTDKFQQNSVSKAIAGMVAARVVDQGSLSWNSTLGSAIPSIFPCPFPQYENVTLAQLNAHASGFDYVNTAGGDNRYPGYPTTERKRLYTRDYTLDWPIFPPGMGFRYGTGATAAISMVEQRLFQTPYDSLLEDFVFRPLMMKTHFGTKADAWGHAFTVHQDGSTELSAPIDPPENANDAKLPVGGVSVSVEGMARFVYAALYSPRTPWHPWSYGTQQAQLNNVGLSGHTASGWSIQMTNDAGGLYIQKDGWEGENNSWVLLWPARRIAFAAMTNVAQSGGTSDSRTRALDWLYNQLVTARRIETDFAAPAPAFPHGDAPTRQLATTASSSSNKPNDEADKAFDGDYNTYWTAADTEYLGAWLKVTLPAPQPFVGHVLVNENGPFDKTDVFGQPVLARNGVLVQAFRVTSYQLYLIDSSGSEWLAATGTTLGVNKLIPVNGYNVTGARLVMNTDSMGPVIKEMHLLPW